MQVVVQLSWVRIKIFVRSKLRWVHKDRYDDIIVWRLFTGQSDQAGVAAVEGAHRRDEGALRIAA
jgi:hypothetical protein